MDISQLSLAEIAQHGYIVLFAWVMAEKFGAPLPALPMLLSAGVAGKIAFSSAFAAECSGVRNRRCCLVRFGQELRPCNSSHPLQVFLGVGELYARARHASRTLLIAKFVPGVTAVAVP